MITHKGLKDYRDKIFKYYTRLFKNPDLRIDNLYYDVKRPSVTKNILGLANEASMKQDCIAIIHCNKIKNFKKVTMINRAKAIFESKFYKKLVYVIIGKGSSINTIGKTLNKNLA